LFKMSEKRQQISLKEKKKYVLLIKQGANLDGINYHYRKKYGLDLARSTFYKWKAESSKILDSTSKCQFREKKKKTSTMEDFEKKVVIEYQKRKTKLKARGMITFVKSVRDDFFQDSDELKSFKFSRCYILRLARDLGRRSSKKSDKIALTEEDEKIEYTRIRSYCEKYTIALVISAFFFYSYQFQVD
jgi:hypothetical protein